MTRNILVAIVDDDASVREATDNLLQAAGFATATFPDAESFLGSTKRRGAACVIADMRMPGMSGLEMHRSLVASGEHVPTVLITAFPEDGLRAQARSAGIVCCLGKPFAPDELLECVRKALDGGRA
jgi:FixJ family two-component response regulator